MMIHLGIVAALTLLISASTISDKLKREEMLQDILDVKLVYLLEHFG